METHSILDLYIRRWSMFAGEHLSLPWICRFGWMASTKYVNYKLMTCMIRKSDDLIKSPYLRTNHAMKWSSCTTHELISYL